ncbi:MAG: Uma2 family endonuclease [Myxococcota bacterium]
MMSTKTLKMDADTFVAWAMEQAEGRFELAAGEVVAMAPECAAHNRVKGNVFRALKRAIDECDLPCEVFTDRMVVRIDQSTVYEPDTMLRSGQSLADDAIEFSDPMIVVEVVSPSTRARDAGAKLADYFRLPSVRHYVLVRTDSHQAIHHVRGEDNVITTAIVNDGALRFDPPGIEVPLEVFLPRAERSAGEGLYGALSSSIRSRGLEPDDSGA